MLKALTAWLCTVSSPEKAHESRCRCCGCCCKAFGGHLQASKADLERWQQQQRHDLLSRVNRLNWIWINPDTGQPEETCPFITFVDDETSTCSINDTKPSICRDYPTLATGYQCMRGIVLK